MTALPNLKLSKEEWRQIEREYCERHLANFVKQAWPILEPGQTFIHGWVLDAICEHLEAVTNGGITRLAISVPPGFSKSVLTSVYFPAFEWGPKGRPHYRYLTTSYAEHYVKRDARRMRDLVISDWYRELWGDTVSLTRSGETSFENTEAGWREGKPFRSLTGGRGDRVIIDDPLSVDGAESEAEREAVIRRFAESVPSRLNDPVNSAIIIIMQRLHQQDVIGYIMENELNYEYLCLPMEYEADRKCVTSIGFEDPRQEEGELLFPERFPSEVVERDKRTMGQYAVASQFQQRPAPRQGGMFPTDRFNITEHYPDPREIRRSIRFWDKACLTSDAFVRTMRGDVPISQVIIGDRVLTRVGYKRVTASWLSKYTNELATVVMTDGRALTGTPDHPVFTKNRGWIGLSCLNGADRVLLDKEAKGWQGQDARTWKRDFSMGADMFAIHWKKLITCPGRVIFSAILGIRNLRDAVTGCFIGMFGNTTTALSPMVTIYTTRTGTGEITTSRIWNAFQSENIGAIMRILYRIRLHFLTRTIERKHRRRFAGGLPSLKSTTAKLVASFLLPRVLRPSFVRSVEENGRIKESQGAAVYDLTVEEEHEFFANGVLVHNSTHAAGKRTAGVLMHLMRDGSYVVSDVVKGQWSAGERETKIKQTAKIDGRRVIVWVEQEPGSGGKESAENTIRNLSGFRVHADKVSGSKEDRAEPYASQVEIGNVYLVQGEWNREFITEHSLFPAGEYSDQVDAAAGAFNKLQSQGESWTQSIGGLMKSRG